MPRIAFLLICFLFPAFACIQARAQCPASCNDKYTYYGKRKNQKQPAMIRKHSLTANKTSATGMKIISYDHLSSDKKSRKSRISASSQPKNKKKVKANRPIM